MKRPIRGFLVDDHRRLERLLDAATRVPGEIDLEPYQEFRAGLLRHIAMEEKVLVPAAEAAARKPLGIAGRLRLEHGAIASLLVPKPTPAIIATLRHVLEIHNHLEEVPDGLYDLCEEWIGEGAEGVVARFRTQPPVPLAPLRETVGENSRILEATRRALARAGFELLADPRTTSG